MKSPTQRTLAVLRKTHAKFQIVERWNPFAKRRVDLFGFIDILALMGNSIVGIQATSRTNHAHRRTKIRAEPFTAHWLSAGGRIQIWSWGKQKEPRIEEITAKDIGLPKTNEEPAESASDQSNRTGPGPVPNPCSPRDQSR